MPPLMLGSVPALKFASSLSRNSAAAATWAGFAMLSGPAAIISVLVRPRRDHVDADVLRTVSSSVQLRTQERSAALAAA